MRIIGDPHLGKRFIHNVPLHRRGEREEMVKAQFLRELDAPPDTSWVICMGDLFDKPIVSAATVAFAADAYLAAARKNQDTMFVVIMGNHDGSRDTEAVTSFDLFQRIVAQTWNIMIVRDVPVSAEHAGNNFLFVPWHPTVTSVEMMQHVTGKADAAFGHWDVVDIGSPHNILPFEQLSKITDRIYTGHDHTPRVLPNGVIVTGSMQPYSHGEDPEGKFYRTVTLAELSSLDTANLCLRVRLAEGEELPEGINALQVQAIKPGQEDIDMAVDFGGLDMGAVWNTTMAEHGVDAGLCNTLFERFRER